MQGGWAIGWAVTAISYTVLFSLLPATIAWRVMFWIGVLPALLVFYIRRHVPEPEVFQRTVDRESSLGESSHFLEIFRPSLLETTLLTALLAVGVQGGYYAITTWLPTYLKTTRKLSVLNTGGYLFVVIVGSFVGYLVSAGSPTALAENARWCCSLFAPCWRLSATPTMRRQFRHARPGLSAGLLRLRRLQSCWRLLHRTVSQPGARSGQGFSYNVGRGIGARFPRWLAF